MSAAPTQLTMPSSVAARVIEPRRGWAGVDWAELWHHRELIGFLAWRDIKVQYKQTLMGAVWAIAKPVASMLIFTLVFRGFARVPSGNVPYPLFVFAGLLPWTLFANTLSKSADSLLSQSHLVTKIYFPRLVIPLSSAGVDLMNFAVSLLVFAAMMVFFGRTPATAVLLLPLLVLLTLMTAVGIGCLLASLSVHFRDVRHGLPFLVQAWLFLSPVVYPVDIVPPRWQWLLAINPMTGLVSGFRGALYGSAIDTSALIIATVVALVSFAVGVRVFHQMERGFADVA